MLEQFIDRNRGMILERTRARVLERSAPKATDLELKNGIPVFLDQLCVALSRGRDKSATDHRELSASAGRHGLDLLHRGLSIGQVVHDYGDICQTITELAVEQDAALAPEEFQTLNLCLDDAIAEAVTEYSHRRERRIEEEGTERLGMLAHELRNLLNTAMLSFDAIHDGQVSPRGSVGLVHRRSLLGLRDLIDRALTEVRLDMGIERSDRMPVGEFLADAEIGARMQADARGVELFVESTSEPVEIEGDRATLQAALANLLQNAFKFTRQGGRVWLRARREGGRVLLEVEDQCGGLPPGKAEELFRPFEQRASDRSGLGLGLSIARRAAHASGGTLRVRDLPGAGCVFTLELAAAPST